MFMSKVPIQPNIKLKGDLKQNWKEWKHIWDAYELVTNLNQQSNEYRVATFITCIRHEALKIHNGLPFKTEDKKKDITKILELWNEYCSEPFCSKMPLFKDKASQYGRGRERRQ